MRIEIEVPSRGVRHVNGVYLYDDMMGCMVRGFSFRALGVFVRVLWRSK